MQTDKKTIKRETQNAVNILGIDIDPLTMEDLLVLVDQCIKTRKQILLGVVNVAKVVNARRDSQLRQSLEEADFVVADGLPIVWLSKMIGCPLPERVAGIDIMYRLIELASKKRYSVYFLGAKEEVVKKVVEHTNERYPDVHVAGYRNGYFNEQEEEDVAEDIRRSGADILFVAMTSPKKENFLRRWREYMQVPVCHGVGGSFDVVAGITKRAPLWMQKCALEWFYRVIQEPRRMWKRYLVTNSIFVWLSLREILQFNLGLKKLSKVKRKDLNENY